MCLSEHIHISASERLIWSNRIKGEFGVAGLQGVQGGFQVDASGIWKKKEEEDKFRGSPHKSSVADGRKNKKLNN